jgi:hypothetical protein
MKTLEHLKAFALNYQEMAKVSGGNSGPEDIEDINIDIPDLSA